MENGLEDMPFYEPGKVPRYDLWHKVDYMDEYDQVWGKKWGASGIGKLREVALVRPTEFDVNPLFEKGSVLWPSQRLPVLDQWQQEHDAYAQALRDEGVIINYIEFPSPPLGIRGPMAGMWAAAEIPVIRGGAIIPRFGWSILAKGRERILTEWLTKQGCPILLTIHGKGVAEVGGMIPLCDDVYVAMLSVACNQEGLDQFIPVLHRCGVKEVLVIHQPGPLEDMRSWPAGIGFHPDTVIAALDIGKVLLYPPLVDYGTIKWLRDRKFEIIEVPLEEQRDYMPANLTVLEPGRVMMHAGAKETISKVRKAGVEVIEIEMSSILKGGNGGICCSTMRLVRDLGPRLEDM